jgi:outer membrane lipoprotein LolB
LQQLTHWRAQGKLALRTSQRAESASLSWQQQGVESTLNLSGPIGMGATTLHSDGVLLQVSRGDELSTYDISSPEAMLRDTGWALPVRELPYWLLGLPAPGKINRQVVANERLTELEQQGWQIQFQAYEAFGAYTLPSRISIELGDIRGKIIIRDWQMEGPQ